MTQDKIAQYELVHAEPTHKTMHRHIEVTTFRDSSHQIIFYPKGTDGDSAYTFFKEPDGDVITLGRLQRGPAKGLWHRITYTAAKDTADALIEEIEKNSVQTHPK